MEEIGSPELYDVFLETPEPLDPEEGLQLLRNTLGWHPTDCKRVLRHGKGLLLERVEKDEAQSVVAALAEIGRGAFVLQRAERVLPPKPQRVVFARAAAEGLYVIHSYSLNKELVPWEKIRLMNIAVLPGSAMKHYLDSQQFAQLPGFHKIQDESLRAEFRKALAQKGLRRFIDEAVGSPGNKKQKQKRSDKEEGALSQQEFQEQASDARMRKVIQNTQCRLDLLLFDPVRVLRLPREEFRQEYVVEPVEGCVQHDYFSVVAWDIFCNTPRALHTEYALDFLLLYPRSQDVHGVFSQYREFQELAARYLLCSEQTLAGLIYNDIDVLHAFLQGCDVGEHAHNVQWALGNEEKRFKRFQSLLALFAVHSPLLPTLYGSSGELMEFRESVEKWFAMLPIKEWLLSGGQADQFRASAKNFLRISEVTDFLFDSAEEFDLYNQWQTHMFFRTLAASADAEGLVAESFDGDISEGEQSL